MSGTGHRLLPTNTNLLQPGSRGFRLSDALSVQSMSAQTSNTQIATLQGQVSGVQGDVTTLQGQIAALQNSVTTLQGQVQALQSFMASFSYYQMVEQPTGTYYFDSRLIYKNSFVVGSILGQTNTVVTYAHNTTNIAYIVNIQAIASIYQGQSLPITFMQTAQAPMVNGISVWGDATNLYFSNGNQNFGTFTVLATMWYTATDR